MPEVVRRFRVLDVLGSGAFGTVYRAEAVGTNDFTRTVAIKLLHREHASREYLVQRMRDEARMLAQLKHRAIVRVDDLVQMEGSWAIVMEFVDGIDLARVATHHPMPPGPAVEVAQEVASALRVAFDQPDDRGIPLHLLHRDIKPANISLTPTGEVRVLDFGIARAEIRGREAKTQSGILGTIEYMAPECFDTGPQHASDMFALGATLYELLTGRMLGRTSIDPTRHDSIVSDALDGLPAEALRHDSLVRLIRSMLAFEATDRPSARDVERALRDLRPGMGEPWLADWAPGVVSEIRTTLPPPDDRQGGKVLVGTLGTSAETFPIEEPPAPSRSWRWALLAALLLVATASAFVLAVGAGGAGLYFWGPNATPQPTVPAAAPDPVPAAPEPVPVPVPVPVPDPPPLATSAPTPAPAPAPVVAPARPRPAEPVAPRVRTATVDVTGAAESVVLVADGQRHPVPGDVPPGSYAIEAVFPGRSAAAAGYVTVHPDDRVVLECKAGFYLCQPR